MKKTISALLIAGFSVFAFSTANSQKIAHVNLDSLMKAMPDFDSAKKVGQAHYLDLENEIESMNKELQQKVDDYKRNAPGMTELVKKNKEDEINQMQQRLQTFQQNAQQDISKLQDSLMRPIIAKAKKAINEVAKEHQYKYVLDTSSGVVVYFEESDDIFALVADKLGIKPKKAK